MKRSLLNNVLVLALVVTVAGVGCSRRQKGLTPIPGQKSAVSGPEKAASITEGPAVPKDGSTTGENVPVKPGPEGTLTHAGLDTFEGRPANREIFKQDTVYFDFDRAEVKASERSKIEAVANQIKSGPANHDLVVEGHCDERGTEEYNRALGERRALAIREYLANLGVSASRVRTISYGEDKPAVNDHNEAAWSKNRRGEFLLLLPKPE